MEAAWRQTDSYNSGRQPMERWSISSAGNPGIYWSMRCLKHVGIRQNLVRVQCIMFFALAKCRAICSGWVLLSPTILCTGGRVINLHGCNYCWNGYYQGRGRPRRHGRLGRAYRVEMVGSADPAILPWSVRPIRPSRLGWFGRAFRADIVESADPTISTWSARWGRFSFCCNYTHSPNAAPIPQYPESIY